MPSGSVFRALVSPQAQYAFLYVKPQQTAMRAEAVSCACLARLGPVTSIIPGGDIKDL